MVSCYWAIKLAACISRIRQPQLQGLMTKSRWSVAEWVQRTLLFCFGTTNVSVLSVFAKHMFISTHMCSTLPHRDCRACSMIQIIFLCFVALFEASVLCFSVAHGLLAIASPRLLVGSVFVVGRCVVSFAFSD